MLFYLFIYRRTFFRNISRKKGIPYVVLKANILSFRNRTLRDCEQFKNILCLQFAFKSQTISKLGSTL